MAAIVFTAHHLDLIPTIQSQFTRPWAVKFFIGLALPAFLPSFSRLQTTAPLVRPIRLVVLHTPMLFALWLQ